MARGEDQKMLDRTENKIDWSFKQMKLHFFKKNFIDFSLLYAFWFLVQAYSETLFHPHEAIPFTFFPSR